MRKYEEGEKVARRSQQLLEAGSFNWFKNLEYLFLLAMHTGKYQNAYEIFHEAIGHKSFDFLPENITEIWNLYRAYLHLLIDLEKVQAEPMDKQFTSFRINRFLNNMPLYSKDKRGMNIAILIVQILFYIQKGKYDTAIDRMEAIEKYCSRYLFKADTMRSYFFIKLLLVIPQASFHRKAVMRYATTHLKKLTAISSEVSHQYHKIEIIPYETLWELTLSSLGVTIVDVLSLKKRRQKLS
jgi:tetratricopeptide (TPR) repeat protein